MTSFADIILLMGRQKFSPISGWEKASSQMEAWVALCAVFLIDKVKHPVTFDMFFLIEDKVCVSPHLRAEVQQQPVFPITFLHLLKTVFDKIFVQALERKQRVRWKYLGGLRREIATGDFRLELVALPRWIDPPERLILTTLSPRGPLSTSALCATPPPPALQQPHKQQKAAEKSMASPTIAGQDRIADPSRHW